MPGADFTSVSGRERLQFGERSAVRLELPMEKRDIGILAGKWKLLWINSLDENKIGSN